MTRRLSTTAISCVLGNNLFMYKLLEAGRYEEFKQAIAWWMDASKAYTAKLVNVGSDETLERSQERQHYRSE